MEDAEACVAMIAHPEYGTSGTGNRLSLEATIRNLERIIAMPRDRRVEFAILLDDRVVGRIVLSIDAPNRSASVGYGIARAH
jgi:RimJ/RimL family protein N-acetyltransferase